MIEAWEDTGLLIIDECSFALFELFDKIEENARDLKPANRRDFEFLAGLNVVFAGDFSHLEPPCREAI
jgi:hypothetical protein